jgi:hypothetical protein
MVGQFYIDTASLKNHARQILISNHKKIVEEDFQYSYKFNMPESDIGKFKVLENSEKFTILDNYNYETPNPNFIENENIFFYESVKSKNKDIPKFGLSSVSYKIMGETKIDKNIKKISVKLN